MRCQNHLILGVTALLLGVLFVVSSFQDVENADPGENSPFRRVLFGSIGFVVCLLGIRFIRQWYLERKGFREGEKRAP